jgi:predicted ATP-dependent endonuclease of OLD family
VFSQIKINGFRCFRDFTLDGLNQFNLVLGKNNAGKTALLEAFFLMVGPTNPRLTLTIASFRGIESFKLESADIWGWLFYEKELRHPIAISATMLNHKSRKLTVSLHSPSAIRLTPQKTTKKKTRSIVTATTSLGNDELLLEYVHEDQTKVTSRAFIANENIEIKRDKEISMPMSIFVNSRGGYTTENVERFSKLEERKGQHGIVDALRILEPRLQRLAVLFAGPTPMIHGELTGLENLIPVPMMGEGFGRILTILLAISSAKDGVVLIDEVETGVHYSIIPSLWKAIADFARRNKTQIIATTHSWECVKGAHDFFHNDSDYYDFRVHQLRRVEGQVEAVTFDAEMVETAILNGMELR